LKVSSKQWKKLGDKGMLFHQGIEEEKTAATLKFQ
jgi:hypothetical protein